MRLLVCLVSDEGYGSKSVLQLRDMEMPTCEITRDCGCTGKVTVLCIELSPPSTCWRQWQAAGNFLEATQRRQAKSACNTLKRSRHRTLYHSRWSRAVQRTPIQTKAIRAGLLSLKNCSSVFVAGCYDGLWSRHFEMACSDNGLQSKRTRPLTKDSR